MTSFAPRFQTPSLVRVEQGIPVTRHLSDLHSPTLPGGPSAPSRKDSMPQSGTPVTGAFGLQGRLGSGMLPVTASSQMVGTSGQARVGGIGRFGDQYHHGVVGGAMSRIPEHQTQHDTSSINLQHQQLGRQHSSNQQAQQQYLDMLSVVSLAQPFARPGTPSFNRQHVTNPSTCQLANIPRKTTVNIMPLQLQQLQQMGAAAMSHQLSPTSVKFPPRQLHQTVEESSQEVSPDQMEDKTTRKGSKGNIVSIRVTSVDDHIVDQIDFSKASLDTDTSETADQSHDQGFKSADQRKPVKLSLKELNLEKCSVSSLTRMFAQNTPAAFQSLQQRLANLPANVYNNNPQILSQLTSQQQQFTPESQSYAQLRSQGFSSNKPGHQSYPTSPAQPSGNSGQYSSPPGVGRYSDQPRFQFPAPTTVATSSYMRSPHLHSGQDKRFAPPPSAPAVGSNPSFSFDFPLMTEPSTPIEGLPTTSSILTWQHPSNTLGRSQSLNISQVQQSGRAGIVLADLHTQSQKSADLTQQASFGGKEPGEARMDLSFSRFQRMGEIPVEKTEQTKPHQQMAHSGLQTGLYREVPQDSSQYQKGYHEGDRKEFSLTGVDTDKDVSGDGGGDDDQRLESISLSVTRHALE